MTDTGHTIGAATDTAAFVREQMARGVSSETLRRRLGIRAEHMLGIVDGPAPAIPMRGPTSYEVAKGSGVARNFAPSAANYPARPRARVIAERVPKAPEGSPTVSVPVIIAAVCAAFDVQKADLLSPRRGPTLTRPRHALYTLCRTHGGLSLPETAAAVGRDHSSVSSGIGRAIKLMDGDPQWRERFIRAERLIKFGGRP
jgi:hypothetical protein